MRFPGVIPAIQTPFDAEGAVDHTALAAAVRRMLDGGVSGFVACGTMGEAQSLTADERRAVVATVVAAAEGQVPVTAGISAETPAGAGRFAADAREAGASAVMALPSLGYAGDEDELVAWYAAIAAETDLPVMAYNNPKAAGMDMCASTIVRIAEKVEGVVAIKEGSGDARRIAAILAAAGDRLEVLAGGDDSAYEAFCSGATGWVSGVAVVAPAECTELYDLCRAGDLVAAQVLYRRLLPLARLDMTTKLVQYFKEAQDLLGLPGGGAVRAPRQPLSAEEKATLRDALDQLQIGAISTA